MLEPLLMSDGQIKTRNNFDRINRIKTDNAPHPSLLPGGYSRREKGFFFLSHKKTFANHESI